MGLSVSKCIAAYCSAFVETCAFEFHTMHMKDREKERKAKRDGDGGGVTFQMTQRV